MINIKGYKYIANRQITMNSSKNMSTILGIMLSIILFTIVGHMYNYYREVSVLQAKSITGNYEAIITDMSGEEIEILKNNVFTDKVGVYKDIYSEPISVDGISKDIIIYAVDNVALKDMFSPIITLNKGRLPQNKNEVMIDVLGTEVLKKDIGDIVNLNNVNYKIVGIYNESRECNLHDIQLITILEDLNIKNVNAVFNVKNNFRKDLIIRDVAKDLGIIREDLNSDKELFFNSLLFLSYGVNAIDGVHTFNYDVKSEFILYLIILILTSCFIYGAINVSVKNRIQQFSILRCIGATPRKIRGILIKESLLLLFYSLIPAIVIGQVICFLISEIVLNKIMNLNNYGLGYKIYLSVLIMVACMSIISVIIAIINPIIKVGKVYPIEGIKFYKPNQCGIKKIKCRFIKKLFGYNGELAYKNINSNRKSFLVTTIVSIIVLTSFVVFVGYYKNVITAYIRENSLVNDVTIDISFTNRKDEENIFKYVDKYISEIKELGIATDIFATVNYTLDGIFKDVQLNKWIKEINEKNIYGEKTIELNGKNSVFSNGISLVIMDDSSLNNLLSNTNSGLTKDDFNNNGVIITNKVVMRNYINPSVEELFNLQDGDYFNLLIKNSSTISDEYSVVNEINKVIENNNEVRFKYLGSIDGNIIFNGRRYGFSDNPTLIVSKDFYYNNHKIFKVDKDYLKTKRISLYINFNSSVDRNKQLEIIKEYSNKIEGFFLDNKQSNKVMEKRAENIYFIVYAIIFLIALIGTINIINNNNINIKNRYREIGMMLAIGISKKRLKRILLLEGVIQCFMSSTIGVISSYLILKILFEISLFSIKIENGKIPVVGMIIGVMYLFIINVLSSYLSIKKIERKSTIDLIRNFKG